MNKSVNKLTRVPRNVAAGVDKGSLVFNGGRLEVLPGTDQGEFQFPVFFAYGEPPSLTKTALLEHFDRNVSSAWGDPSAGVGYSFALTPWATVGGTAAEYNVTYPGGAATHGVGTLSVSAASQTRIVTGGFSIFTDVSIITTFGVPVMPAGTNMQVSNVLRYLDANNHYLATVTLQAAGTLDLSIAMNVAGTTTTKVTLSGITPFTVNQNIQLEAQIVGSKIQARVWIGSNKPDWQLTWTDPVTTFSAGLYALRASSSAGTTNSFPYLFNFTQVLVDVSTSQTGTGNFIGTNHVAMARNRSNALTALPFFENDAFEFTDAPVDSSIPISSLFLRDKYSGALLSDASLGRGMADPQLQYSWFDPAATKSTTSGSFTNFASILWRTYHPFLLVAVLINVPSGTTYEVRVNENGHAQQAIASVTNFFGYRYLFVNRDNTSDAVPSGAFIGQNGTELDLDLEWRRVSGSGTATMVIAETYGFDQL